MSVYTTSINFYLKRNICPDFKMKSWGTEQPNSQMRESVIHVQTYPKTNHIIKKALSGFKDVVIFLLNLRML